MERTLKQVGQEVIVIPEIEDPWIGCPKKGLTYTVKHVIPHGNGLGAFNSCDVTVYCMQCKMDHCFNGDIFTTAPLLKLTKKEMAKSVCLSDIQKSELERFLK